MVKGDETLFGQRSPPPTIMWGSETVETGVISVELHAQLASLPTMPRHDEEKAKPAPVTPTKLSVHLARYAHTNGSPSPVAGSSHSKRSSTRPTKAAPLKVEAESDDPEDLKPQVRALTTPKAKYTKKPRPYASPDVYKHLRPVNDHLGQDLSGKSLHEESDVSSCILWNQVST